MYLLNSRIVDILLIKIFVFNKNIFIETIIELMLHSRFRHMYIETIF